MDVKTNEPIIDVDDVQEEEDGLVVITLSMNDEGADLLIKEGFISILKTHLEEHIDDNNTCNRACSPDVSCECGS